MTTNYPGSNDVFSVPSLPEDTPLSQAGAGNTRNLTESVRDQGDAIEALETHAAQKTHNHDGGDDPVSGPKLLQANTHQSADTDTSTSAIHHTIGGSGNQAAAGNHVHDYKGSTITNKPFQLVANAASRPSSPEIGTTIIEQDTGRKRVWIQFPGEVSPSWRIIAGGVTPVTRIRQGAAQTLTNYQGTVLEWHEELEDNFGYFSSGASLTNINIKEPGLYYVECTVQWDAGFVPDVGHVVLCINGVETTLRDSKFLRGNFFVPGFSQTLYVGGNLRFTANDVLSAKASWTPTGIIGLILTWFDAPSRFNGRLDANWVAP